MLFDYDVSAEDLKHLKVLCREEFDICYSTQQKMALFAVEQLNGDALKNKVRTERRSFIFTADRD